MNRNLILFGLLIAVCPAAAQPRTETENVILITLDGFRWQELYRGADPVISKRLKYVHNPASIEKFQRPDPIMRRKALLPFLWSVVASQGQLYGNRDASNFMDCSNPYWFSYPGYHEMLVGAVDNGVCSNMKFNNPNCTVLEFINKQPTFRNSVAAFVTWDVFPYILRQGTSGIIVNGNTDADYPASVNTNPATADGESDSVTFNRAFEYLKEKRPRVMYIALDETDHFAHQDCYDRYLVAAHQADQWIAKLWNWIQSDPTYRGKTTLLITTDHGRGQNSKKSWRHHGRFTRGSGQIWMAALGPDTPADGELKVPGQFFQKQIARTIAELVGLNYKNTFPVGETIHSVIKPSILVAGQN